MDRSIFEAAHKDVLTVIALKLEPKDILKLCLSSKRFNTIICSSNDFWRNKLLQDFNVGNVTENPKEVYSKIVRNRDICNQNILEGKFKLHDYPIMDISDKRAEISFVIEGYLIKLGLISNNEFQEFTESDYYSLLELLKYIRDGETDEFTIAYLNGFIEERIPLDVTWENLCNYPLY